MSDQRTEQFTSSSRKEFILEGPDGPKTVLMIKLVPEDLVEAGIPAVCFDVTVPGPSRDKKLKEKLNEIGDADLKKRVDFQNRIVKASLLKPKVFLGPIEDTPPDHVHPKDLGAYADLVFLKALEFSGILTAEASAEAVRMFRDEYDRTDDPKDRGNVRDEAERPPSE